MENIPCARARTQERSVAIISELAVAAVPGSDACFNILPQTEFENGKAIELVVAPTNETGIGECDTFLGAIVVSEANDELFHIIF